MVFPLWHQRTWLLCSAPATGNRTCPASTLSLTTKLKNDVKHFTSDKFFKGFRFKN